MGVNSLLEQKIQVERSEMMSLQNDVDHFVRVGGPESMYSGSVANRKVGKMSQYLRKQQSIIRSIRSSTKSGLIARNMGKSGSKKANDLDRMSQNQRQYMKYQTKKNLGNQSDYRGG